MNVNILDNKAYTNVRWHRNRACRNEVVLVLGVGWLFRKYLSLPVLVW